MQLSSFQENGYVERRETRKSFVELARAVLLSSERRARKWVSDIEGLVQLLVLQSWFESMMESMVCPSYRQLEIEMHIGF